MFYPVFLRLHNYAIDIALSAVSISLWMGRVFVGEVQGLTVLLLFLAVVGIYNLDRYLDTIKQSSHDPSLKKDGLKKLLVCLGSAILILVSVAISYAEIIVRIRENIALFSLLLFSLLVYFLLIHYVKKNIRWIIFIKELLVSSIFFVGCFMPLYLSDKQAALFSIDEYPAIHIGTLLVLFHNALLFSFLNYDLDKSKNENSILSYFPLETAGKAFTLLGLLALLFVLSYPPSSQVRTFQYFLPLCLMIQGILFRYWNKKRLQIGHDKSEVKESNKITFEDKLRIVGDQVFLWNFLFLMLIDTLIS